MRRAIGILLAFLLIFPAGCAVSEEPEIIENEAVLDQGYESSVADKIEIIPAIPESSSSEEESSSQPEENSSQSSSAVSESSSSQSSSQSSSSSSSKSETSSESSSSKEETSSESSKSEPEKEPETNVSAPRGETRAFWISYLEYQSILTGKTQKQFRSSIRTMFQNLSSDGFNTVYAHVRSHSDAMYDSDIFPWSVYCAGKEGVDPGFDPLEIMVEEAHGAGLYIEAWINPYRVKNTTDVSKIASSSPAYDWLGTGKVVTVDGTGIFYNPADEDVIDLVVSGVEEIVRNYDVDGIHFDDYFYPTTAKSFDSDYYEDYVASGGTKKLAGWRRQNVNTLIKEVYSAIKAIDSSCRFGVSPAGNIENNYNSLYCDVYTWVSSSGYVDYICPQIYFGFNNKSRPYLTVLDEFSSAITNKNIELIVGLSAYKCGAADNYAGTDGKNEWINRNDILSRQVSAARNEPNYGGFALYRYDSVYNPSSSVKTVVKSELENLKDIM